MWSLDQRRWAAQSGHSIKCKQNPGASFGGLAVVYSFPTTELKEHSKPVLFLNVNAKAPLKLRCHSARSSGSQPFFDHALITPFATILFAHTLLTLVAPETSSRGKGRASTQNQRVK